MPNKIPILDLDPELDELWDEINHAIQRVLRSKQFILGPEVLAFEEEVAGYLGVKHAVGVNSGTDGLTIGLRALGIGPGDEVITTAFSFFASAESISALGAQPVFVDINPGTFNIDPDLIEEKITPKTRAIMPVHLFGQATEMDPILELAKKYRLKVVEDTAQAFSGEYQGKKLGTLGDFGAYSFFPSKNLGCYGDGGLLVTNNDLLAEKARMLRAHGARKKYYNEEIGYNSRLDALQAAILRVKLPHIDRWSEGRRRAAQRYNQLLQEVPDLTLPHEDTSGKHVYHQYTVRLSSDKRAQVQRDLEAAGIGSMIYYAVPVHKLPVYSSEERLPQAETAANQVLSLPIWPQIKEETQQRVATTLRKSMES